MKMYHCFWMIRAMREFVMYFSVLMGRMGVLKRARPCYAMTWSGWRRAMTGPA